MNDLPAKYAKLVDLLYDRTVDHIQKWNTSGSGDLETYSSGFLIRLSSYRDGEGEPFEAIEIYNSDDEMIESFNDGTIASCPLPDDRHSTYYNKMEQLRSRARREALGADQALKTILADLEDDIPF